MSLSDQELLARLILTEDSFVERKSSTDKGGWLQTTVAFANSTPIGYPAVLFLGVEDDGVITNNKDPEVVMKSFSDVIMGGAYPPIYTEQRIVTKDGQRCVAVIVPGSDNRPHFAGKAYVRDGTQTREASDAKFEDLISQRSSKVRMILSWMGKTITLQKFPRNSSGPMNSAVIIKECNIHYVVLGLPTGGADSYPLSRIDIGQQIIFYNE